MTVGSWAEGRGERSTMGEEDEVGGCAPTPKFKSRESKSDSIQGGRA